VKKLKAFKALAIAATFIFYQSTCNLVPVWRSGSAFLSYDFYVSVQRERSGVQPTAGASFFDNLVGVSMISSVVLAFSRRFPSVS
jgi:hypothetical protein